VPGVQGRLTRPDAVQIRAAAGIPESAMLLGLFDDDRLLHHVGFRRAERSTQWEPLATKLVAEVEYVHFTNGRFRHGTKFLRWRPDKKPSQCTFEQVGPMRKSPLGLLEPERKKKG
jgi:hypothetical protein